MAIKRIIDTGLWFDPMFLDEFDMYDQYFWLFCLSNHHNNLCGVSIISKKTITRELKLPNEDIADNLIDKFSNKYKRIKYNNSNNEMIILNWYKYNWSTSNKVKSSLLKQVKEIKTPEFQNIVLDMIEKVNWSDKK